MDRDRRNDQHLVDGLATIGWIEEADSHQSSWYSSIGQPTYTLNIGILELAEANRIFYTGGRGCDHKYPTRSVQGDNKISRLRTLRSMVSSQSVQHIDTP
jgi:hypothetical protein